MELNEANIKKEIDDISEKKENCNIVLFLSIFFIPPIIFLVLAIAFGQLIFALFVMPYFIIFIAIYKLSSKKRVRASTFILLDVFNTTYSKRSKIHMKFETIRRKLNPKFNRWKVGYGYNLEKISQIEPESLGGILSSIPYHFYETMTEKVYWMKIEELFRESFKVLTTYESLFVLFIEFSEEIKDKSVTLLENSGFLVDKTFKRTATDKMNEPELDYVIFCKKEKK